ncbi:MAG: hypothetical protein WCK70_19465 [Chloroflexales bacterium]
MHDPSPLCCANCGTPLDSPGTDNLGVTCPVCQFFCTVGTPLPKPLISLDTLGDQLSELVTQARASGIPLDAIIHTLRDELEFAAELASGDRDLCVQIVDLGPRLDRPRRQSSRDVTMMLRGRAVGG